MNNAIFYSNHQNTQRIYILYAKKPNTHCSINLHLSHRAVGHSREGMHIYVYMNWMRNKAKKREKCNSQ
jgi:hypothetical protein